MLGSSLYNFHYKTPLARQYILIHIELNTAEENIYWIFGILETYLNTIFPLAMENDWWIR